MSQEVSLVHGCRDLTAILRDHELAIAAVKTALVQTSCETGTTLWTSINQGIHRKSRSLAGVSTALTLSSTPETSLLGDLTGKLVLNTWQTL
jgi:hypothetical protein